MKSGQFVYMNNHMYLFLGYIDYAKKRCLIADSHGNKIEAWSTNINIYKS